MVDDLNAKALKAWRHYRDHGAGRHLGHRQMRRREFIAGYLTAVTPPEGTVLATHWPVGTRLVGDEGFGPTTIRITAVTEQHILAVSESHGGESLWRLDYRKWTEVTD